MSITGTGTKADPYVVHDWEELNTAIADSTAYVTVADNVVINLLDIYPEGIPNNDRILTFECKGFDGNGITIKNAYCMTQMTTQRVIRIESTCEEFSNFNFVNFYLNLGAGTKIIETGYVSSYPTLSKLQIKGIAFSSATGNHTLFQNIKRIFDSVINIKITFSQNNGNIYNTCSFDSCWLRFDTNSRWAYSSVTNTFINSYLEGRFVAKANNTKIIDLGAAISSIINARCEAGEYTGCSVYAFTGSSLVVVNTNKLIGDISLSGSSATVYPTGVTDVQLKSEEYMETIFPVVSAGGDS